jgi:hypothetical protein
MEKKSPSLSIEMLVRAIATNFAVEVQTLEFREKGWGGYSYLARSKSGSRFFLKVQPLGGPEWASAPSSPEFYLPVLHQLHAQNIINVPELVLTRDGGYSAVIDGYELALYDFIDGEVVGFGRMPGPVLAELAGMVGKLHAATSGFKFEHEFRESYGLSIEADLFRSLDRIAQPGRSGAPGEALLQKNLPRIREPILAHMDRFRAIQEFARKLDKTQVVCHTDLHGGNLMIDEKGELVLLDWENAMLAPPEQDLYFIAGKPEFRDVFLPRYEAVAGPVRIDPELLEFYWYRRALEDVAGFLTRILAGDGDEERDRSDLGYLVDNISWMDRIETDVARFRKDWTRSGRCT